MSAPRPDTSHLLFDESSHAGASGGIELRGLDAELERLAHRVGLDGDVALGIDELRTEAVEERTRGVDVVGGLAKPDAERVSSLLAGLRGLEEGLIRPAIRFRRGAGRIERRHVDAGMLLHQVDARARALDLRADGRRHGEPVAVGLAEIGHGVVHGAVLLDQRLHDVVQRHEALCISLRPPGREREDVVTGARLRFRRDGHQVLVALRRNVVDRDFDLFLLGPFTGDRFRGLVGARDPVIPETDRELAGGMRAADVGCGDEGRGGESGGLQGGSPRHF